MHLTEKIAVIIPAWDEAENINGVIVSLRKISSADELEIAVVDGHPAATTLPAIDDQRVMKIAGTRGRARQMNLGASLTTAPVLLFLHADTALPPDALRQVRTVLAGEATGAGAFRLGLDNPALPYRLIAAGANIRTALTGVPYGDQAIFIRRAVFDELGGYRDLPLMEEVDLLVRVRRAGYRVRIAPGRVTTSARRWERHGIIATTLRNWYIRVRYLFGASPSHLARTYYRGKI